MNEPDRRDRDTGRPSLSCMQKHGKWLGGAAVIGVPGQSSHRTNSNSSVPLPQRPDVVGCYKPGRYHAMCAVIEKEG